MFYCMFSQAATSSRSDISHESPPPGNMLWCLTKLQRKLRVKRKDVHQKKNAFSIALCSSHNVKMPSGVDETTPTPTSPLICLAVGRLAVASCVSSSSEGKWQISEVKPRRSSCSAASPLMLWLCVLQKTIHARHKALVVENTFIFNLTHPSQL